MLMVLQSCEAWSLRFTNCSKKSSIVYQISRIRFRREHDFFVKISSKYLLQLSSIVVYWTEFCVKKVLKVYFAKSILCLNMHEVFLGIMRLMRDMLSRLFVYFLCIAHLCKTDHDGSVWSWKSVVLGWSISLCKIFYSFSISSTLTPNVRGAFLRLKRWFQRVKQWNDNYFCTICFFFCFAVLAI